MGAVLSIANDLAAKQPPPPVVLVPPMFQRDLRDLSRFCKSSYHYLAARKQLSRLLDDYLSPLVVGRLALRPPDDDRISVRAKLGQGQGAMALRWQPLGPAVTHTFVEATASPQGPGGVAVRGSFLDPATGLGAFAVMPLDKELSGAMAQVGLRYSSPALGGGAIATPRNGHLHTLWLAARHEGLTLGLQLTPDARPGALPAVLRGVDAAGWLRRHSHVSLSYSPLPSAAKAGGLSPFTACVEMAAGRTLSFSFFQHIAASRRVVNPFEEDQVVAITNYIDIGLLVVAPIGSEAAAGGGSVQQAAPAAARRGGGGSKGRPSVYDVPGVNLAAAWQINKNWLVKARVGSDSASAAVGLRLWHAVSAALTASATYVYATGQTRYGASLSIENFGDMRYERGADDVTTGRALLQRHEASAQELANATGRGVMVMRTSDGQAGAAPITPSAQQSAKVAALL